MYYVPIGLTRSHMCVQDSGRYTVAIIMAMVALTYGLTIPSDICVYGDMTMAGSMVAPDKANLCLLDACVKAKKKRLVLAEMARKLAEIDLEAINLREYEGLQVSEMNTSGSHYMIMLFLPCACRHACARSWEGRN